MQGSAHLCSPLFFLSASHTLPPVHPWLLPSSVTGHNFSSLCLCTLSFSDWRLLFSATQSPQHQFQNLNAPDSSGKVKTESESHSVVSHSLPPHGGKLYSPWKSPGQNTRVGSLSLLQGIFPTQGSNPGLLHCRQILYQLSYEGSLIPLEVRALLICPQRVLGFISLKASNSFNVVSLAGMCFTDPFFTTQTRGYGLCLDDLFSLHNPAQRCGWSRGLKLKFC